MSKPAITATLPTTEIPTVTQRVGRRVLIVCAHEPEMDPRIDWAARYAPASVERVVLGFVDPARPRPSVETVDHIYTIERISRSKRVVWSAVELARRFLSLAPWRDRFIAAILLAGLAPALVVVYGTCALALAVGGRIASLSRKSRVARIVAYPLRFTYRLLKNIRVLKRFWVLLSVAGYYARTNAAIIGALDDRPDFAVLHVNDLETLPAGVLVKWQTGARLIYDSHEYWPYSDVEALGIESRFWKFVERYLVGFVDIAFTVSDPLADELTSLYGRTFVALPNCEPTSPRDEEDPVTAGGRDDRVRFLYQGNFAPQRGLEELLSAWRTLTDPRASLFLRGPDSPSKQACQQLAAQLGLQSPRVEFLQPVRESALVSAAVEFDVGIIPYKPDALAYRFACPNKLSQYMQAGLAILTNDLLYVSEVVRRYGCGLVYSSHQPATIAETVQQLTADRRLLEGMKRRAKAATATEFNWQKQSAPLYVAYVQV